MDRLARRLGLKTDPTIFFVSAVLMIVFLVVLLAIPGPIGRIFADGRDWIVSSLGWFFIIGVTVWVLFLIWVALSKYGNLKLGKDDDEPAYSNMSWFAMLFAGGIGTVLMFWGVAEPISHFATPPIAGVEPYSVEAARDAMSISLYHLSIHTWAIFTLPGLAFGFFVYRYDLPMRFSSVFYPILKERIYGPIGKTVDIFAVLGTLFGLAVSLGLGTSQIAAGLNHLTGISNTTLLRVVIITILTAVATASIVAGLDKGVKRLSNINILGAVALMIFVLVVGDTVFLMRQLIESTGTYLQDVIQLAFWNDAMAQFGKEEGWGWQGGWTVFYWAWTVTWSPFMGVFLARISRGRTIKQFVVGVLVAPSVFTLVWFVTFGWSAMELDGIGGDGGPISAAVGESVPTAIYEFLENYPFATLVSGIAVVIVALFFATSSDSASLVVDMLCAGDVEAGPVRQRVFWGVSEGFLAASLIVLGGNEGLETLQQVITVMGLPVFILVFAMLFMLLLGFKMERERTRGKPAGPGHGVAPGAVAGSPAAALTDADLDASAAPEQFAPAHGEGREPADAD